MKMQWIVLVLLFTYMIAGCQNTNQAAPDTIPSSEAPEQIMDQTVSQSTQTEEPQPSIDHYLAYQWMLNLKAEDVAYVEFINLGEPELPYRRYEGDEIQEVIDLFQAKECSEYTPILEYAPTFQWRGYYSKEFHVVLKDGTAHTVCSVYSTETVIDGVAYHTISAWLNNHWPESGNAPLPENWAQEAASRNYHIDEASASVHSTASFENERALLDQSYNTDVEFGSLLRHYPIGRGGIELSASGVSQNGCTLNTYWTGTSGITSLHVQTQYWLEKWQPDSSGNTGYYHPIADGQFFSETPEQLSSDASRFWYVSWKDDCGILAPGHYRIGMIFYEEYNGNIQNETTCYAKFSITE